MKSLKKRIKNLQKDITDNISYVNNGGCAHFSYFFAKKLEELGINYEVILLSPYRYLSDDFDFIPVYHVAIYVEGIGVIDAEDIGSLKKTKRTYNFCKSYKISLKELDRYRKVEGWNHFYNRSQNRHLNYLIKRNLNVY